VDFAASKNKQKKRKFCHIRKVFDVTSWKKFLPALRSVVITTKFVYLLTPCCRGLFEKLTALKLVKKFLEFHVTRMFITALKCVRQISLYCAGPIQFIYPRSTYWRSVIIIYTHPGLDITSSLFPLVSSPRPYTHPLLTHTAHMPRPSNFSRFYPRILLGEE